MLLKIFSVLFDVFGNFSVFLGYLNNLNSFPKPLTLKQEQELFVKIKEGDPDARNTLIEHNLRLVAYIVKKYSSACKDTEDLISVGTIGLIKAVNTFDNSKGTRLATYAARCIENEILMVLRIQKKLVSEVSLNEPIGVDYEGNEIDLIDILTEDPEVVFNNVDTKMKTDKLYVAIDKVLNERERKILKLRYGLCNGKCLTQQQISKLIGISRSYVSRIEKKSVSKIKKFFKDDLYI